MHRLAPDAPAPAKAGRACPCLPAQRRDGHDRTCLREPVHLGKVRTDGGNQVRHPWMHGGSRLAPLHLGQRTATAFVVPVVVPQPVPGAGGDPSLALLTPGLGRRMLPARLAVALVSAVLGVGGALGTLPRGVSRALTGLVSAATLRLHPGSRQHETWAMGPAHGAGQGGLRREAGPRQNTAFPGSISTTTPADAEGERRYGHARSGEEKLWGPFSGRCPWVTFSAVILANFLSGDNNQGPGDQRR
jgi:hypothetical protein